MAIRLGLEALVPSRQYRDWVATKECGEALVRSVQIAAERIISTPHNWALKAVGNFRRRFSPRLRLRRRQQALLATFDDHFEQLVDLICWAAQSSISSNREFRYKEHRSWIRHNYAPLRDHLRPFWTDQRPTPADRSFKADPFESLICSEKLEDLLVAETSIDDMMRCRTALDKYRQLLMTAA